MFLHVLFHDVLVVILHSFPSLAMQIELVQVGSRGTAECNFGVIWSLGVFLNFRSDLALRCSLVDSLSFGGFLDTLFRLSIGICATIDSVCRVETPAVDLRIVFSLEPLMQISLIYSRR